MENLPKQLQQFQSSIMGITGSNRPIRLRLSGDRGAVDDLMLVKHVNGRETMCGGFEYRLLCVAGKAGLPLKLFNAMPVELQLVTDKGELRSICGFVARVAEGESDGGLATYQLVIRDALSLMDQRTNTRVFRGASEIDITNTILREWLHVNPVLARGFNFSVVHTKAYPVREFTMQYNESDAAFLRRLWKRRGLAWFFKADTASQPSGKEIPGHTLFIFDNPHAHTPNAAGTIRYHRDDGTERSDSITAWHALRSLIPGRVTRHSWDYLQSAPIEREDTSRNHQGPLGDAFAASLDEYLVDVPHAGDDGRDYDRLTTLRMQRHEYEAKFFEAESGVRDLCVGEWIGVRGHAEIDSHAQEEREFVITELQVDAKIIYPSR